MCKITAGRVQVPGVYQAGVFLWKCQDTSVSQVALFGAGYHAFLEWYGVNNTCAPFLRSDMRH